jgi:predicted RNA-binding Zn ribbon-like protein
VAVAGLVDRPPGPDTGGFGEALQLREAMHRLALAASGGADYSAADRQLMNRVAARPPVGVRLDADGSVRRVGTVDAALADLARAAVELFGGPGARMIKECSAPDCTRLYVDNSRRGARRWCDMAECGNRAKAAGFRARHAQA